MEVLARMFPVGRGVEVGKRAERKVTTGFHSALEVCWPAVGDQGGDEVD